MINPELVQNHIAIFEREARQLDHFSKSPALVVQKAEKSTDQHDNTCPIEGRLVVSALRNPYPDHSFTDDTIFEDVYQHLILSCFILPKEVKNLSACHNSFNHFHIMLNRMKSQIMHKLFQCDIAYASQTTTFAECRLQFLFLAFIHHIHLPSIIWSLPGNYDATCRDPEQTTYTCPATLLPELLTQLKRILCRNPSKFKERATTE